MCVGERKRKKDIIYHNKSPKSTHGHLRGKLILENPVYPIKGKKIQVEKNLFLHAPGYNNDAGYTNFH